MYYDYEFLSKKSFIESDSLLKFFITLVQSPLGNKEVELAALEIGIGVYYRTYIPRRNLGRTASNHKRKK